MNIGRIGVMRPEMFAQNCVVYKSISTTSERGRELTQRGEERARISCVLSVARVEEQERFKQLQKTVTHTLLQRGSPVAAEHDTIELTDRSGATRAFRVQGVHDKGGMGIDTVYYCEERCDG